MIISFKIIRWGELEIDKKSSLKDNLIFAIRWWCMGYKGVCCFYLTVLFPVVTSHFKGIFMIKITLSDLKSADYKQEGYNNVCTLGILNSGDIML